MLFIFLACVLAVSWYGMQCNYWILRLAKF